MLPMTPILMRRFWSLVEMTQTSTLLNLDDTTLTQCLLGQFTAQQGLDSTQASWWQDYIHSHLALIRDLAGERQGYRPTFA